MYINMYIYAHILMYIYVEIDIYMGGVDAVWHPTETCKLDKPTGEVVQGHVSNGDFQWESPRPPLVPVTGAKNGTIRTPVAWGWKKSEKREKSIITLAFTWPEKDYFFFIFMMWLWSKKRKTLHYSLLLWSHVYSYSLFAHTCGLRA